jgi:hypothetical protein
VHPKFDHHVARGERLSTGIRWTNIGSARSVQASKSAVASGKLLPFFHTHPTWAGGGAQPVAMNE